MTDKELALYLGINDWPNWQQAINIIEPSKRAVYERMANLEIEIALWQEGLGPKPSGVLIDMARTPRKAKSLATRLRKRAKGLLQRGADH